MYPWDLECTGH